MNAGSVSITAVVPNLGSFEFYLHARFDQYISGDLLRTGIWEPFETEVFRRLCMPGDFVVDIGANIGWYSVIASRLVGKSGRVLAIEPDPDNSDLLMKNIATSGGGCRFEAHKIAVAEIEGTSQFFLSKTNLGDHHLFDDGEPRDFIEIKTQTLDGLLGHTEQRPNIIKSDTQGSEARILQGADKLFTQGWRPVFILEFWPYGLTQCGSDPWDVWKKLLALGYAIYELSEAKPQLIALTEDSLRSRVEGDISVQSQGFINLLCLPSNHDRLDAVSDLVG